MDVFTVLNLNASRPAPAVGAEPVSAQRRICVSASALHPCSRLQVHIPSEICPRKPLCFQFIGKRVRNTLKISAFKPLYFAEHAHSFAASPAVSILSQKQVCIFHLAITATIAAHHRDRREVPYNHRVLPHARPLRPRIAIPPAPASLSMRGVPAKLHSLRATSNRALTDGR